MNALLSGALLAAALAQLPPNHPPVPAQPPAATEQPATGALPPNHPPMGGTASPGQVPAGHPPASGNAAPSVEEMLAKLDATPGLRDSEKTFEIASAVGNLYYSNARFADGAEYFRQAWEIARPVRRVWQSVRGEKPAAGACPEPSISMVRLIEGLKTFTPSQKAGCVHAIMEPVREAGELWGLSLFLAGQPDAALKALDAVLEDLPTSAEALFGRASVLLETKGDDVKALQQAKTDLLTLQRHHPGSARAFRARALLAHLETALQAGGISRLAARKAEMRRNAPPPLPPIASQPSTAGPPSLGAGSPQPTASGDLPTLSKETIDAFQSVQRTPELERKLTTLVEEGEAELAKGRFEEALNRYRQVMPLDPENGRVRAGLAWAMVGLQRPAADRIWTVAVSSDPAAVEKLGQTLEAKGDANGAQQVWKRLAESAPDYAQKSGLSKRLR